MKHQIDFIRYCVAVILLAAALAVVVAIAVWHGGAG